jgi:hypothetical protein
VENTLAYYDTATIAAVKSFVAQGRGFKSRLGRFVFEWAERKNDTATIVAAKSFVAQGQGFKSRLGRFVFEWAERKKFCRRNVSKIVQLFGQ